MNTHCFPFVKNVVKRNTVEDEKMSLCSYIRKLYADKLNKLWRYVVLQKMKSSAQVNESRTHEFFHLNLRQQYNRLYIRQQY